MGINVKEAINCVTEHSLRLLFIDGNNTIETEGLTIIPMGGIIAIYPTGVLNGG